MGSAKRTMRRARATAMSAAGSSPDLPIVSRAVPALWTCRQVSFRRTGPSQNAPVEIHVPRDLPGGCPTGTKSCGRATKIRRAYKILLASCAGLVSMGAGPYLTIGSVPPPAPKQSATEIEPISVVSGRIPVDNLCTDSSRRFSICQQSARGALSTTTMQSPRKIVPAPSRAARILEMLARLIAPKPRNSPHQKCYGILRSARCLESNAESHEPKMPANRGFVPTPISFLQKCYQMLAFPQAVTANPQRSSKVLPKPLVQKSTRTGTDLRISFNPPCSLRQFSEASAEERPALRSLGAGGCLCG